EGRPGGPVAPRDALLVENGQTYLRIQKGAGFENVAVKVLSASDTEVVFEASRREAIAPGVLVARKM
ncbi:MAG: hypothetical protein M1451_07780, partial [Acidobacteria bacterium]|nr:hypothetical protein [Acidobacteriota bacterium]